MPHKTGHEDKWGSISAARKRAIREEMLRRWKQKLRKKGAAKAAGGNVKAAGGTGSMKGYAWQGATKAEKILERKYAQAVRKTQRKKAKADSGYKIPGMKKTRKAVAKTARATGAGNVKLVKKAKQRVMKSKSKGGTVSFGSHKGTHAKRMEAQAWRKKHVDAAKKKYKIGAGSTAAQRQAFKDQRANVIKRHKHMLGKKPA
jgi:hypothetical protein